MMKIVLVLIVSILYSEYGFSQKKQSVESKKVVYTWDNKVVTYKQYRDSMNVLLNRFSDSLHLAIKEERKKKKGGK